MSVENPTLKSITAPSAGAFAAAEQAYLENGQEWIDQQILKLYKRDVDMGGHIMMLACLAEADGTPPGKAIFLAVSLLLDAISRDASGEQIDHELGLSSINP